MISEALLGRLACPVCLEAAGCASCGRPAGHAGCDEYATRVGCGCGGPDKVALMVEGELLRCGCCGEGYPLQREAGCVELVPRGAVGEVTHYAEEEFQERLAVKDGPPVLSARVKADMMLRMLAPRPGEAILDLGCGAGKFALYTASRGAAAAGLDVAPFFLARTTREVDLVLGDLRRLPFRKGAWPGAYTLDVLEHLDEAGVREVLLETRRVLAVDGRLFVYTHAMESSRIASFQRAVNRLAKRLGQRGLIDHEREAMRKSDHVNAIASHEHFEQMSAAAGLKVVERRYYNVVFKAVIEDLVLRLIEQRRRKRKGVSAPASAPAAAPPDGPRTVGGPAPPRLQIWIALVFTWVMKLDVVLFGHVRTGPFFGLLRPEKTDHP